MSSIHRDLDSVLDCPPHIIGDVYLVAIGDAILIGVLWRKGKTIPKA
jgi:hypothetical protein